MWQQGSEVKCRYRTETGLMQPLSDPEATEHAQGQKASTVKALLIQTDTAG